MTETQSLLDGVGRKDFHSKDIEVVFKEFNSTRNGLTNEYAREVRHQYGFNDVPQPIEYPAWLCCLLPCLLNTESMRTYNEVVPEHAMILRNGKWRRMESNSLVPGDIVKVEKGDRVPADMRVFECVDQCTFDTRMVNDRDSIKQINIAIHTEPYESSTNMALLGYLCVEGSCSGVVVCTGESTVIGSKIRRGNWNPR